VTDIQRVPLVVQAADWLADGVLGLTLRMPDDSELAEWTPGAHLEIQLPSGLIRHYSLCGSPHDRDRYEIAVGLQPDSRGGSREVHTTQLVGRTLTARGPKNNFELIDADDYLFFAGGIGITPILPMIRAVAARDCRWRLIYGGRTRATMAFVRELQSFGPENLTIVPQDAAGLIDVAAELRAASPDTAIYCCGPEGLLDAVQRAALGAGLSGPHFERFDLKPLAADAAVATVDTAFEVELRKTGVTLSVPAGRSLLDVVLDVVPNYPYSCEEGYCGTCETAVLDGAPDHRDTLLSEDERRAGKTMMICVGRARSERLVLDI
jgi:ferredoxin-NADP reductase